MKLLAIDLGDARTGIAACDKLEMLASPVCVVHETDPAKRLDEVVRIITEQGAERVVVGYPKNMNNTLGERAEICAQFASDLEARLNLTVVLWDERGTTVSATNYLNATNTRGKKRKQVIDAVAATIILDSYMAHRKHHPDD